MGTASRWQNRNGPSRSSFTLIELLVVIAIISLLISILTPSLSRARQQAKATVCMATLNEMMKGIVAYGNDYDFALPPMRYQAVPEGGTPSSDVVYHGWAEALYQSMYGDDDYSYDDDFPVMHNHGGRFPFWVCKENEQLSDTTGHYRVYQPTWARGSLDAVHHRLPLITDANPYVTDPDDLRRSDIPTLHVAGLEGEAYIDERHYGGANYAFRDGHVERSTTLKERLALDWDLDPETENL
jgi:prepilin-type N-terminal cleavage/methylation domain-containing protein/prepilin-type processing-associated H-X9-DG protein